MIKKVTDNNDIIKKICEDKKFKKSEFKKNPNLIGEAHYIENDKLIEIDSIKNNQQLALYCIQHGLNDYNLLGTKIKENLLYFDLFMKNAIKNNNGIYFTEGEFIKNENILKKYLDIIPNVYKYASKELKSDLDLAIYVCEKNKNLYSSVDSSIRRKRELFKYAVWNFPYPYAIDRINFTLTNDELYEFLISIKCSSVYNEFKYRTDNKNVLLKAYMKNKNCLGVMDDKLSNDKEFILELSNINSEAIIYSSKKILGDKGFIMLYIEQCNSNNQYIRYECFDKSIYENKNIITMIHDSHVLSYVPDCYKEDKDFMEKMIANDYSSFNYIDENGKLIDDDSFIHDIVLKEPLIVQYISRIKKDYNVQKELEKIRCINNKAEKDFVYEIAIKPGGEFILDYYPKYKSEKDFMETIRLNKEEQFLEFDIDEMWEPF